MSFSWDEYVAVAQDLLGATTASSGAEARARSAISRSYYAAFCVARNYLRDVEGLPMPSTTDVHGYVRRAFASRFDSPAYVYIADSLDRLRRARNRADYADVFPNTTSIALNRLRLARETIAAINTLSHP